MKRLAGVGGLVLLCGLAVAVRSVGFERVFAANGPAVVLAMDDAQYHARRAAFTFDNFPGVLSFDPYLNYPQGAFVPWPPLYDFALGGAGRWVGALDVVLAWAPVLLGLLTVLVVFAVTRVVAGPGVGPALAAVSFLALLPVSTSYTSVGNPDHHAAVALLGTMLLLGHLASLAAGDRVGRIWAWQLVLVVLRLAMLLTWHGSILYVALAEGLGLLVAAGVGRREQLLAQGLGCGLAALGGVAALSLPHSEFGGAWSAVELSRLQPAALAGFALVALTAYGVLGSWERQGRRLTVAIRLGVAALLGLAAAGVVLGLAWGDLAAGWAYMTKAERFIGLNYEAQPLWRDGFEGVFGLYGYAAVLLPFTPLAGLLLARSSRDPGPGLLLAGWTGALLVLATSNARYGSDFAPAASVSFALLGVAVLAAISKWRPGLRVPASVAAVVLVPALLWGPISWLAPHASRSLAVLGGYEVVVKRPGLGFARSVYAFARAVRGATPETEGYDDPGQMPAYGILTPPTLGFIVNAVARRATPAGNFGPYVGRDGIEATNRFYLAKDERSALRIGLPLRVRYVITSDEGQAPATLWHRLHHGDGGVAGRYPALGHFRLVTESTQRGVPLGALRGVAPDYVEVPYKLFEIVGGAVLSVSGKPGEPVVVEIDVGTPSGRMFTFVSRGAVGPDGRARVRVPYATERVPSEVDDRVAQPRGPYRVRSGEAIWEARVAAWQIDEGAELFVPQTGPRG